MRRGAVWSAVLHVLVMLVVILGLPHFARELPEDAPIPVEIVTVADKTTQKDRPPEPPQPPKPQVKPPEPQQAQPKPEPPKPIPTPPPPAPPQQKAEAKPTPAPEKAPEPKAEPIPDKTAKKEPPPKAPEKTAPQRFAEAKPQKKPQPTRDDFVASLLKNVAPPKPTSTETTPEKAKTPSPPPPQPRATAIDDQLTMSEIDFIRRQYIECWNPPAGARDARDLVVSIRVDYNPDGSVRRAAIEDTSRMSDPFFRTAAESALRAVLNPRCNPLKVPSKKYDSWKTVTLSFNPREMLGT
jgi:hypothetical protein